MNASEMGRRGQPIAAANRRTNRNRSILSLMERILKFDPQMSERELVSEIYKRSPWSRATTARALADIRKTSLIQR